jgi:hypothetical protein
VVNLSGVASATTTTDVNGDFSFLNLAAGSYTVTLTLPRGVKGTTTSNPVTVTLGPSTAVNFGLAPAQRWTIPLPSGTSADIGPAGLHADNFRSIEDQSGGTNQGKIFALSGYTATNSLDIVLQPASFGTATTPTVPVANGTVLAVWSACQAVLIDHGHNQWAIYLHQANIPVKSGDSVATASVIGYSTTTQPTSSTCGYMASTTEEVQIAFLTGSGTSGSYVAMLGRAFCGYAVAELNHDPTQIILRGLTQTASQAFTVPTCTP